MSNDDDDEDTPIEGRRQIKRAPPPTPSLRVGTAPRGFPRVQSQTDRDLQGAIARDERERERKAIEHVEREITGNVDLTDEDRRRLRKTTRTPEERITRLEDRGDILARDVKESRDMAKEARDLASATRQEVSEMRGELKVLPEFLAIAKSAMTSATKRDDIVFDTKVHVHRAAAEAEIAVGKETTLSEIKKSTERYAWVTKALAIAGAIGTAIATAIAAGRC